VNALLLLACSGSPDTGDPVLAADFPGWTRTRVDTTTYARWDGVREDWEIRADWPGWFPTLLGDDRRFQIVRPSHAVEGEQVPVLFALHGAAIDDDSDPNYYAGDPTQTLCGAARAIASSYVDPGTLVAPLALERGWAVVAPEGLWCDGWKGLGRDDLADPEHHFGFVQLSEVKDFVDAGAAGFAPASWYAWGSSSGANGAILSDAWKGGFDAIVADSPPCDWLVYWHTDRETVEHLLGGSAFEKDGVTPSPIHERYLAESCDTLVRGSDTPVFHPWNWNDNLVAPGHNSQLQDALAKRPDVRSFSYDFDRYAPAASYHTQTQGKAIPMAYVPALAFTFLEGRNVRWLEAEDVCTDCDGIRTEDADEGSDWDVFSHAGGVTLAGDGATVAATLDDVPGAYTLTVALRVDSSTAGSRVRIDAGTSKTIDLDDLVEGEGQDATEVARHLESTRVDATTGTVTVAIEGEATVRLDAFALTW
jgi:hypothetical protein